MSSSPAPSDRDAHVAAKGHSKDIERSVGCEVKTVGGKLQCELPAGHAGAHMHFGTNGTTAWGGTSRV